MRFTVVTIFPEMFDSVLAAGVLGRARTSGKIAFECIDPRNYTSDRHRSVDDTPYGGGPGMVMKVEPLVAAIEAAAAIARDTGDGSGARPHRILMSPRGQPLTQDRVRALAQEHSHLVLVCGRYEGIDERVSELAIDEELSIGDYVLSGGEIAAMAVIDAVSRYVPGVLGEATSTDEESFSDSLLEYPQYTRPASFRDREVPEVLLSGHHGRIAEWRRARSLALTAARRPDLLARHRPTDRDREMLAELAEADLASRTHVALLHYPVYDRKRNVVTTALTNLDLHDIARSTATYGLGGYYVVTPVAAQREKADRILRSWRGGEQRGADNRIDALERVHSAPSLADVVAAVTREQGRRPRLVATSAQPRPTAIGFEALARECRTDPERGLLLVFGTGWGLSDEVIDQSDQLLIPICGRPPFNHLSVRSAVAVVLDRLFGLREA